ncbi:MAG TPA: hypothetical protein VJH22_07290 [Candidatus Nanoarchaeia archaeon]|nr:hypothetical protein [Candidatus Nanoarchaeia archaeon]
MNLIKRIGPEELEEILKQDDVLAKIAEALKTLPGLDPKTEAAITVYDENWQTSTGPIVYACDGFIDALRAELIAPEDPQGYLSARTEEYRSDGADSTSGVPIITINVGLGPQKKYFPGGIEGAEEGLMANTLDVCLRAYGDRIKARAQQIKPTTPLAQWEDLVIGNIPTRSKLTQNAELSYDPKSNRWTDLSALRDFEVQVIEDPDLT